MGVVEMLEAQVAQLGTAEFSQFSAWFAQYRAERDADTWDAQIERDAAAGKLDTLAERALAHYRAGRTTEI